MSLASRLRHTVTILRVSDGDEDERGVAQQTWEVLATVRAWVQPRSRRTASVREQTDRTQGGPVVSEHTIFMLPTDIRSADLLRMEPDDGRRFEITGIRNAGGRDRHLEIDAQVVGR